jgi:hypothetical protein
VTEFFAARWRQIPSALRKRDRLPMFVRHLPYDLGDRRAIR